MSVTPGPRANVWLDELVAYKPGAHGGEGATNIIRLASNECPLGPNPKAIEAARASVSTMHRYADGGAVALRNAIADKYEIEADRVICGTGSDELLQLCPVAFCAPGDEVIHSQYGFMVYPISARRVGAVPIAVPETDFKADVDAMLAAVTGKTRVVYIANPNNPTGTRISSAEIARLHARLPSHILLVLDGAYAEYIEDPTYDAGLALARTAPNVLMTRTFSKLYGLAGERIGWAYGSPEVIAALNKIRGPFNVSTAGQAAAIVSIGDDAWADHVRAQNATWRDWLFGELTQMGLEPIPSETNFLLTRFKSVEVADAAVRQLSDQGIYVRHLPKMGLADCVRLGIGTEAETKALAAALKGILQSL